MSYMVRYEGTKEERMQQALADAVSYLGDDLYDRVMYQLVLSIKHAGKRALAKQYAFALEWVGLRGAPARAMALEALRITKGE